MFGDLWRTFPLYLDSDDGGGGGDGAAPASGDAEESAVSEGGDPETPSTDERIRETILAAHPDVIPEMVTGNSWAEMLDSVPAAQEAYARVAAQLSGGASSADGASSAASSAVSAQPQPPSVPAGDPGTPAVNYDELSPAALISLGVQQQNARS